MAGRFMNRKTGAESGENRLFDNIGLSGAGANGGFNYSSSFGRSDTGRHGNQDVGFPDVPFTKRFVHEISEHRFGHPIIGNDAIAHWSISDNTIRSFTEHFFGFGADRQNFIFLFGDRDDRRLIEDNSLSGQKDQRIYRAEINAEFFGE